MGLLSILKKVKEKEKEIRVLMLYVVLCLLERLDARLLHVLAN